MPKQTFLNLSEEKRAAFTAAAIEEFASHEYEQASVSRLVAQLGIAKGSLYQYFEDKRDLFLYLVGEAQKAMLGSIQADPPPDPGDDFFRTLRWQMGATVRTSLAHPLEARLVQRAYGGSLPFRDELLEGARHVRQGHFRALVEQGMARAEISPDLDPDVVVMVVNTILGGIGSFLMERLSASGPTIEPARFQDPQVEQIFDQVIGVLEHGLRPQETAQGGSK